MKKITLLVIVVLVSGSIYAQDQIKFGLKAGVNFANLVGDDIDGAETRVGLNLGGLVEIPVSEKFSFQPELAYSQYGTTNNDEGSDISINLDYLTLPLLAKFYVAEGFSLEGGPQLGFKLKGEVEVDNVSVDLEDGIKGFDYGITGGVGYSLPMGIFFQARYYYGLSDVFDDFQIEDVEVESGDIKNAAFQLSVGYKF